MNPMACVQSHKLAKLICSDSEPKDKSDTRSVAFNEVESSDNEPKDKSDTRSVASTKLKVLTSESERNPMACYKPQVTFCKAKCSDQ